MVSSMGLNSLYRFGWLLRPAGCDISHLQAVVRSRRRAGKRLKAQRTNYMPGRSASGNLPEL